MLFAYRCCPHTSTVEAPYILVYARDPPLPIHNLIKVVEPYKGDNELGKRIEQSRVLLSIAAKWLSKMRDRQKRHYLNMRSTTHSRLVTLPSSESTKGKNEPELGTQL